MSGMTRKALEAQLKVVELARRTAVKEIDEQYLQIQSLKAQVDALTDALAESLTLIAEHNGHLKPQSTR